MAGLAAHVQGGPFRHVNVKHAVPAPGGTTYVPPGAVYPTSQHGPTVTTLVLDKSENLNIFKNINILKSYICAE